MSITTYSGLLTELTRLLDGEDVSGSEVPTQTLAQVVHLGELRVYRDARTRWNEKAWGITTTSNLAAMPSDFITTSIVHFGGLPLTPITEDQMLEYLAGNPSGDCMFFCQAGSNLQFGPSVGDGTTVQGRYFYKWPDLDESTLPSNTMFLANEDVFIYAALAESAPFFGQDARVALWDKKYFDIMARLNGIHQRAAYSAGRIQRGNSAKMVV